MFLFSVSLVFSVASCQRFGKMREVSLTNNQVILAVEVDPQSSTFAFNWFARINDSSNNV